MSSVNMSMGLKEFILVNKHNLTYKEAKDNGIETNKSIIDITKDIFDIYRQIK
jgi:hypothetical protein